IGKEDDTDELVIGRVFAAHVEENADDGWEYDPDLTDELSDDDDDDGSGSEDSLVSSSEAILVYTQKRKGCSVVDWFSDSACTKHISSNLAYFSNIRGLNRRHVVIVGNGEAVPAEAIGDVNLNVTVRGRKQILTLRDVLYVPEMKANLLSLTTLTEDEDCKIL